MTTQQVHEKRRKRISPKKVDQYRAESAFLKQRNQTLVNDLRHTQRHLGGVQEESNKIKYVLRCDKSQLQNDVMNLEARIEAIKNVRLVRFALWFKKLTGVTLD